MAAFNMKNPPIQPPETDWHFVEELQSPLWTQHFWTPRERRQDEVALLNGVYIEKNFPDPDGLLETAYADMADFLRAGDVTVQDAPLKSTFVIETVHAATSIHEEYRIQINQQRAIIRAADSEGIRRGLFYLQDEMLRHHGPFLQIGEITRKPVIRTRISRCFFGPINRPPKNRDELTDDVNYYPDQYLNRLAHHGINGLWLTVKFGDLCPSRFFPEHGKDAKRRLEKLRQTVRQCARFGIKIYIFCIEPRGFGKVGEYMSMPTTLQQYPALAGHTAGDLSYFCTSSDEGKEYLESCTHYIFSRVPGLGGLIDINLGERPTHCYSNINAFFNNNCPRCSKRTPGEVFADTLAAMQRGMTRANEEAELISWLYVPYFAGLTPEQITRAKQQMADIAAHIPPKVLLQVNFESGGVTAQWGREHVIRDYSLAYVGPSDIFADCARAATQNGARVSAKLQVGNSHEVATVPFVPAPGNLYRKYQKMRELGVSSAMQCWFFGNYPSVMTQAAGELAFDPLPENEIDFLRRLASTRWSENAATVAAAWQHFRDAYAQFPAALQFSWFGPVHDCISWPLHLMPVDEIIQPSWLLKPEVSGDRVAECFAYEFTHDEIIETCHRMDAEWNKGVQLLETIKPRYAHLPALQREIGVAQALGLQFRSAWNMMRFYALRDALPHNPQDQQLADLEAMQKIAYEEIANSTQLSLLAQEDSRLGFHSEAEGYKYFPAKLAWRIDQIKTVLQKDFPAVHKQITAGKVLFSQFFGTDPQGPVYQTQWMSETGRPRWEQFASEPCHHLSPADNDFSGKDALHWKMAADDDNLYVLASCRGSHPQESDRLTVTIEPQRCWPSQKFTVSANGIRSHENRSPSPDPRWSVLIHQTDDGWEAEFTIQWACLRESHLARRPIRINVSRTVASIGSVAWQSHQPLPGRLIFGDDNSRDYGWVVFEEQSTMNNK